jgi:hypothetical protein
MTMYHNEPPDPDLSVPEPPENKLLDVLRQWAEVMNDLPLYRMGQGDTRQGQMLIANTRLAIENAERDLEQAPARIIKIVSPRQVLCLGCDQIAPLGLGRLPSDLHQDCPSTKDAHNPFWVEIPQEDQYRIAYPNGMSLPLPPAPEETNPMEDAELDEALLELDTRRENDLPIEKEDPGGELEKEYYLRGRRR